MQPTPNSESTIKVALADDHILLRNALANLIDNFERCKVICHASNGKELIEQVQKGVTPDVILLDLNMPVLDGYETAKWFHENQPDITILMLTLYDAELVFIRLLQVGVKGFLKKDILPSELKHAIHTVADFGSYYSHNFSGKLANLFRNNEKNPGAIERVMLSDQEIYFLKNVASEMTYKEIAREMNLSPRSVDAIRDQLFQKLDIKSRVGLVLFAIRKGIVSF